MKPHDIPTVAVIADAHLHDIESDYDGASIFIDGQLLTLRSWADTRQSSRVFNESHTALMGALTDIVKREVKHVVLLGDYADDGQIEAIERVVTTLRHLQKEHGVNFYAIPGNHDFYGPVGKHQSTRFAVSAQQTVLVTSDPETAKQEPDSAVLTRKMFCLGAPEGLMPMADFGLFNQSKYLHWETPFGTSDAVETRLYPATSSDGLITHQLMDASYLVEPSPGLWLLMLDANVFEPRNGTWNINQKRAFKDSSDAGWNSVLRNKPFLFEWITDVCKRADEQGKNLLTFSHYPALDPFNDNSGGYAKLFGQTEIIRRQPGISVAEKLLDTGLQLHFGGHMHVNGVSRYTIKDKQLTHISVPSPVTCPAAYQLIQAAKNEVRVDTISLASLALDTRLIDFYKKENIASQVPIDAALNATNYGDFLYKRIHGRVLYRYFKNDWPNEIVQNIDNTSVADLMVLFQRQETSEDPLVFSTMEALDHTVLVANLQSLIEKHHMNFETLLNHPLLELIVDWYCLRDSGSQAYAFINPDRINMYRFLSAHYGDTTVAEVNNTADFFSIFLGMMHTSLQGLSQTPSSRQTINLA
ncbi:MAG: 3',5'-cyclic AMP phosphodiesterase CpdA [Granulosicoccus sp.]|jgi:3',5'-cyclic AMP phosphodiesterase CpdA